MLKKYTSKLLILLITIALTSCSEGGGGDKSAQTPDQDACGVLGLNAKIVNGSVCTPETSPIVQLIITYADSSSGLCSGTLITPTDVLTAAHCFLQDTVAITVGTNTVTASASEIRIDPNFIINQETGTLDNDAAIVKLSSALPLPTLPILRSRSVKEGDLIAIFGYGKDENGTVQVLRSGEMRVSNTDAGHILAIFESPGSNTCNGDSGGPALGQTKDGAWGIIGITSSGSNANCAIGDNSLFTSLSSDEVYDFVANNVTGLGSI